MHARYKKNKQTNKQKTFYRKLPEPKQYRPTMSLTTLRRRHLRDRQLNGITATSDSYKKPPKRVFYNPYGFFFCRMKTHKKLTLTLSIF